jgi:hypothetical protein
MCCEEGGFMKKVVVCGSIAYDNIMDFPGLFKEQILPDKIHALNVSFLVKSLKRVRGGTAPNIAYNLRLVSKTYVLERSWIFMITDCFLKTVTGSYKD